LDWLDGSSGKTSASCTGGGSNPEQVKSPTRYQRIATAAILMCGPRRKAAEMAPLTRDTRKGIKRV